MRSRSVWHKSRECSVLRVEISAEGGSVNYLDPGGRWGPTGRAGSIVNVIMCGGLVVAAVVLAPREPLGFLSILGAVGLELVFIWIAVRAWRESNERS